MDADAEKIGGAGSLARVRPGSSTVAPFPGARAPMVIRVATMEDLPFMDELQKANTKALGFFPRAQMEGYVRNGGVLVAEGGSTTESTEGTEKSVGLGGLDLANPSVGSVISVVKPSERLGYIISRDRYLKRDELGVIYQLCVAPGRQRGLVGASLVKEVFERSAYGCRLYCCWCAQDLEANYFWESLGFVPIAFRAGSRKSRKAEKQESRKSNGARVHIFWQRRIRSGDVSTPWWFPAKTDQGAMRADRLVLPIPPGVHWSDPMPVLVAEPPPPEPPEVSPPPGSLEGAVSVLSQPSRKRGRGPEVGSKGGPLPPTQARVQFGRPGVPGAGATVPGAKVKPGQAKAPRNPRTKCDPKLIAAARELRDRWMEAVNTPGGRYELEAMFPGGGKYDVSCAARLEGERGAVPGVAGVVEIPGVGVELLPAA